MKSKLLLILCLMASFFGFAQLPTDEIARYSFTSGSLINEVTPGAEDLAQTGTATLNVNDRFATTTNAKQLNGDYLTRGNFNSTNSSLSFWIKTATNDSNYRTIFDKSFRSGAGFGTFETGFHIYQKDGQVGIQGSYVQSNAPGGANTQNSFDYTNTELIDDDEWHHVVVTMTRTYPEVGNFANAQYLLTYNFHIFIDGVSQSFTKTNQNSFSIDNPLNANQNLTIANKTTASPLTNANVYLDEIDDIYLYERALSTPEVNALANNLGFCFPPTTAEFSITNTSTTATDIIFPEAGTYDIAVVENGMAFASATIINSQGTINGVIPNLAPNTTYNVYIRKHCDSGSPSAWSGFNQFTTSSGIVYVNQTATGLNDGASWANAHTDLQTAFTNYTTGTDIWVATGTYVPDFIDTAISFNITEDNTKVYGGFSGTETSLSQRDISANPTVLSGDLFANDDAILSFGNTTRADNSLRVLHILIADDVTIDGFTVSGGEAIGSGAGIHKNVESDNLVMRNIIVQNNVAVNSGAGMLCQLNRTDNVRIENAIFRNNLSTYYSGIYAYFFKSSSQIANVNLQNVLFDANKIEDAPGRQGQTGPAGGFKANNAGDLNLYMRNCTVVNNTDQGTLTYAFRGAIYTDGTQGQMAFYAYNSIFWNNSRNGNVLNSQGFGANIERANNVIAEDGLLSFPAVWRVNVTTDNPLFTDLSGGDYSLQGGSPGIDAGDNSKVLNDVITDLAGEDRIISTTVDLGAYELRTACNEIFNILIAEVQGGTNLTNITWAHSFNSSGPYDLIYVESGQPMNIGASITGLTTASHQVVGLTAGFYDIYVRAYCAGVPGAYTMTTVGFDTPIFVNENATGLNTGVNWQNAFVLLEDALAVAQDEDKIWIAGGTYTPPTGSRSNRFTITQNDLEIYGGFVGTETLLSERNFITTESIMSGDINNDDSGVSYNGNGRDENAYHVVKIDGNNILLDGIVVEGGQANATSGDDRFGGAIFKSYTVTDLRLKNSTFRNNFAIAGAAVYSRFDSGGHLDIQNSSFHYNLCSYGGGVYTATGASQVYSVTIANSLFYSNTSQNNTGTNGYTGSAIWLRASGSGVTLTSNIVNCTFAENTDIGTQASTQRGAVSLSKGTGSAHSTTISNTIFYGNKGASNVVTPALTRGHTTFVNAISVDNSIAEDDFSTVPPSVKNNTSNVDPLFANVLTNDYTLTASSPAVNTGDNTYVIGNADLQGNQRIFGTTVDMGAYEYSSTLGINDFSLGENQIKLYPNPASSKLNIQMKTILKSVAILNIQGQIVIESTSTQIDISNLSNGMYIISIEDQNGFVSTKRFIKN
ncbi:choice-of-anchor Q domain-containing protein [Psychroserpens jangbogonensis]|uniref:choice-of-anchor Q domain-containing protein n=1 Tax=Psychroserpens jangbogonensis TaxID=1484460 RepID=UPI00053DC7E9|nr:choice-of-anchor Q domain-containing protein [Psychroserpens jangbogonensis]